MISQSEIARCFIECMPMLFERTDFSEKDMYRCLDHIAKENEHIHMDVYPGNTHDSKTLIPMVNKVGTGFGFKKTVFVADRGIISEANVCKVHQSGNGYIFSYSVRKAGKEFKDFVLDQEGYKEWKPDSGPLVFASEDTGEKNDIGDDVFKSKSRIVEVTFKDEDGVPHKYMQKQVIFYSPSYAHRTKCKRDCVIAKAESLIGASKCDSLGKYGAGKYIATTEVDRKTGDELKGSLKTHSIDWKKIAKDELYDGYYAIMSSEIDLNDSEIISGYKELWHIEESFRIPKSDLKTRPIYVRREDHIKAHFLICFVSLVILRILEIKLKGCFKASAILSSLRKCECTRIHENIFQFLYMDGVLKALEEELGIDFATKYRTLKSIKEQFTKMKPSSPIKIRRAFKRRTKAEIAASKKTRGKGTSAANGKVPQETDE